MFLEKCRWDMCKKQGRGLNFFGRVSGRFSDPFFAFFVRIFVLKYPHPKNLFGLFWTFRVICILQGYFWRPSENTLWNKHKNWHISGYFDLARLFLPCKVKVKNEKILRANVDLATSSVWRDLSLLTPAFQDLAHLSPTLTGMFRLSASLAIPHRRSFAAIPSVSLALFWAHESQCFGVTRIAAWNCPRLGTFKTDSSLPTRRNGGKKQAFESQSGLCLGNRRNIVLRVLFRRRELTEPHWVLGQTWWVLQKTRWDRFVTQIIGWEELTEFSPRNSVRAIKLTEFGVWNRTLRNRIRPVSECFWRFSGCWHRTIRIRIGIATESHDAMPLSPHASSGYPLPVRVPELCKNRQGGGLGCTRRGSYCAKGRVSSKHFL